MRAAKDTQRPGTAETEEFMSIAAHDVRNPVAVMRAAAQMAQRQLNRGDLEGAQQRLKTIVDQTERVAEMLETFLDVARISSGRLPLKREQMSLRDVVDAAVARARFLVGEQVVRTVELDLPDECIGAWDRPRIIRALQALVANALAYGEPAAPVRVQAQCNGSRVHVVVGGGGPGPDGEEVLHLFERFYRGRSAAEAGLAGSGLGLYLARGIARLHGGDVRRLEGDRFEIDLPLIE